MSDSNWPEPTPEPGETPRWLRWGVIAAIVAAGAIWLDDLGGFEGVSQRFQLPETFEIAMPEIDLRGREEAPVESAPVTAAISEAPPIDAFAASANDDSVLQDVPFDQCLEMSENMGANIGRQLVVAEDNDERRVLVIKFGEGDLRIICSRADDTMTIRHGS